jgi:hypothetical protein
MKNTFNVAECCTGEGWTSLGLTMQKKKSIKKNQGGKEHPTYQKRTKYKFTGYIRGLQPAAHGPHASLRMFVRPPNKFLILCVKCLIQINK